MDPRFSRAYGALAGLALGDALGMPTQAMSPAQIRAVYGRITGLVDGDASQPYAPGMPAGSVTDDTEQALLVASLLVRGRGTSSGRVALDAGEFAHALLAWEDSMIERGSLDLLGPSTKAALERVRAGEDPLTVGGAGTTNGAAMRVTPIGIAMSTADPEAFADAVWSSCQVTHATRQGFQSAALVAAAVSMGIDAVRSTTPDLRSLLWKAVTYVDSLPERGAWTPDPDVVAATRRAMQLVANPASSSLECLVEQVGTSVASAQAIPMAFALLARDPSPQALLDAANIGGDTDTIGAIAGAILGAVLGFEVFVGRGLAQVELASHLDLPSVALDLLELRAAHEPAASAPTSPETEGASEADVPEVSSPASSPTSPAGRVVLMTELILRYDRTSEEDTIPAGNEWTTREDVYLSLPFTAMRAARAMGVEVVSLSPIGEGPRASVITEALAREGIVDAGPRIAGYDNGFLSVLTTRFNGTKKAGITGMLEDAWDEAIRMLGPSDVLYIDASIAESQEILAAAEHALAHLPHHVRVILDSSGGHIGPRCLPSGNVLMVLGHGAAERLCLQIVCDRSSHDSTRNPNHAASYVLSLFKRQALVITQTHESFLARPKSRREDEVIYFPAPTVISTDPVGTLDVSTGVLAAGFVLGCTIERSILLANCAGALASTMPGPTSCPTRAAVETAADTLADRTDASWQRRGRAYGALAGVAAGDAVALPVRGMSPTQIEKQYKTRWILIDADASHPTMPGAPAGTLTEVTREVLAAASHLLDDAPSTNEAGAKDEDLLAGSCYPLRAIPVGIANSTADPQAFVDAVWQVCGNDGLSRQEFHAAALVAAAVSLGIDHKALWLRGMRDVLDEAITYVSALPARGTSAPGPDVLAAARAAIDIVTNYRSDALERLRDQIGTSADPAQSVPAAFGLVAHYSDGFSAFLSVSLGGESSIISAIAGSIVGAAWGVTHFSSHNLTTIEKVSRPALAPLAERLFEQRECVSEKTRDDDSASGTASSSGETVIPLSDTTHRVPTTEPHNPAGHGTTNGKDPASRVVLMGQILVDRVLTMETEFYRNHTKWVNDKGPHVGGGLNALVAARRMGAEAVSLSPIGEGPHASLIEQALAHEGIVDAGPRVEGVDNGFCVALIDSRAERTFISTKGAETMTPASAWADFVRTMTPHDVLYIDGYLMDHPANREAAEAALHALPEGVRVVLDVSPMIGIPDGLPTDGVIVSMNHREAQEIAHQRGEASVRKQCNQPREAARAMVSLLHRPVLVRAGAQGAYFVRPAGTAPNAGNEDAAHIPTPHVEAIDTNGAGDAHSGVLAASLAQGIPLERALVLANCAGALSTTVVGPASCPTHDQIEAAANALAAQEG